MPIYVRTDDLSYYNIPAAEEVPLEAHKVQGAPPPGLAKDLLELYKLEYEKGVQRHDDLYKAAWTNFSYMAIVAGAVLTFGGDRFLPEFSALLACLPLLFWWLASFEPLNRYGDKVIDRLSWIEVILTEMHDPDSLTEEERQGLPNHKGLRHFREFKAREKEKESRHVEKSKIFRWIITIIIFAGLLGLSLKILVIGHFAVPIDFILVALVVIPLIVWLFVEFQCFKQHLRDIFRQFLRVRFVIRCFAAVLLITAICLGYMVYKSNKPLLVQKDSDVKVIPVDFNNNLGIKLDGITAKKAQELLEKAEQQKVASPSGK